MDIEKILASMSLENKAKLCIDGALWRTASIPENDVPILYMSDGTNGLRFWKNQADQDPMDRDFSKNYMSGAMDTDEGLAGTYEATCFPTGSALACSWDRRLARRIAGAVANECKAHKVGILFGPGLNTRRHPLDCRGFEYFSEDPCLSGEMAGNYVIGLQEEGVSGTLKHFACNNQNFQRTAYDSVVEERALREVYLAAFERAVKIGNPGAVMVSYNLLNGVQACENPWLMRKVLREEWGYEGLIISDSSAVKDPLKALDAGLDWIMPFSKSARDAIVQAVREGRMDKAVLDFHVRKVLETVSKYSREGKPVETVDFPEHHRLAQEAASKCAVLLKNENDILPVDLMKIQKIAVIGHVAEKPVYQGTGCACVHTVDIDSPLKEIRNICGKQAEVIYAKGYGPHDEFDRDLMNEATKVALDADVAIVFVAARLPHEDDRYNRPDIRLSASHDELVSRVAAVQRNTVVVINNNESVELPWADDVKAILDMWYSGEGSGKATANLLFGLANPSGKLPVTFPYRLEDTPGYLNFPGENFKLIYEEGIFVGYRYYEKRNLKPRYAFGHGLSYTRFEYSDAKVSAVSFRLGMPLLVSVIVRNTGDCEGEEVVQLYVRDDHSRLKRPFKELKHFEKCKLKPGEQKTVVFHLSERDFEYYDPAFGDWIADSGNFDLMIGSSSDDIRAIVSVMIESPLKFVSEFKPDTHFMDIFANPVARKIFYEFMIGHGFLKPEQDCQFTDTVLESTFWGIAQYLDYMIPMQVTPEMVEELMQRINEATH